MSTALPLNAALARVHLPGRLILLALTAATAALSVRLWPQWRHNPDLSHGLFMPFVFVLLLHESRAGTQRFLQPNARNRLAFGALVCGGLAALFAAGLYAAAVDWTHALVNLMLTLSLVLFLGAGVLAFARDAVRLIPFNWPSVVAATLWLLAAPIPPGTYTRLTLNLQLWVSEGVLRTLHVLGIAAIRHGNIIELARTSVGVEEACSGIRSLVSCVFAGFFFSATLVRRPWARALIIALAAPIALGMNFLRSLGLTLLANGGIDIGGAWHDVTGFAVLGITAAILGGLALLLERGAKPAAAAPPLPTVPERTPGVQWALFGATAGAAALVIFFAANTRPSIHRNAPVPDLFALVPETFDGWQVKTTNLYEFSGTLQTEHLVQRNYLRSVQGQPIEIIIYVAYWHAGQAPVSLVASHTPDACWPGSGWVAQSTQQARTPLHIDHRTLPDAEYRMFQAGEESQHVWFWHLYDGRPISYRDPYSPTELLRIAWRYGFRHDGDQVFVRVSSNRPWSEIAREPVLETFFARVRNLGL
jgi:exosortase